MTPGPVGPPRLAERLVRALLPPDVHGRTILGDLHEEHRDLVGARGRFRAGLWYWRQVLVVGLAYRRPDATSLEGVGQDVRHALRALRRSPGVSVSAALGIALAVGVGTAIYSVVDAVLLTPLPFDRPHELVRVWASSESEGDAHLDLLYEDVGWVSPLASLASAGGFSRVPSTLLDMQMQNPEDVTVIRTSDRFFQTLGVRPVLGRLYEARDASRERQLVVISYGLWTRRFGGDPGVIGTTFHLELETFEVVGVLPEGVQYPEQADAWHALPPLETMDDDRELQVVARLAPGATLQVASEQVRTAAAAQARADPEGHGGFSAWVQPLQATVVRDVRTALYAFLGAVGLILLITCVNTANLLFARAADRHHEIAVRTSLGASRGVVVRYHLVESLLLAALGGLAGVALGHWVLEGLLALTPRFPRLDTVALDGRVLAVMAAAVALVGVLSGVGPALSASVTAPADALREGGTGRTSGGRRLVLRSGLVAAEIAMSTALVVLAVLLFGTFRALLDHDRGFDSGDLIAFRVDPLHPPEGADANRDYYGRMMEGARGLPAVVDAALASHPILELRGLSTGVTVEGMPASSTDRPEATVRMVSDGYFQVARVPLRAGRTFGVDGGSDEDLELVVNETLVRRLLEGVTDPVGAYLETEWFRGHVVGVVGDVSPAVGEPALPMIYLPFQRAPSLASWLIVRVAPGAPPVVADVWREIHAVDRYILSTRTVVLEESVQASVAPQRFNMLVVVTFSGLALALAAVGIYGVTSYNVVSRRAEIGIRRALGASRPRLASSVLGHIGLLTGAGVLLGLAGAVAGERLVASLLVGVRPGDPAVLLGVGVLLALVASAATAVPLVRAIRIAPTEALRPD